MQGLVSDETIVYKHFDEGRRVLKSFLAIKMEARAAVMWGGGEESPL